MALIRAGMARRLCGNGWSHILRELHTREKDIRELIYLHRIKSLEKGILAGSTFEPFSAFDDRHGYSGFYPSPRYVNTVYIDYISQLRPFLDQHTSSLSGRVLKWDHSFKVGHRFYSTTVSCPELTGFPQLPKHMAKLDGTVLFSALFTVVNEYEQVRWQALVPTKALEHIKGGLEGIVSSLKTRGLPPPLIAYTDNVHSDYATAVECIPSLKADVPNVQKMSSYPIAHLGQDVTSIPASTFAAVDNVCAGILQLVSNDAGENDAKPIIIGVRLHWKFMPEATFPRRIVSLHMAAGDIVHHLHVSSFSQFQQT